MKIAFIVSQFPTLSETFILNQITGLLDRGHEVDIFAWSKGKESKVLPEIMKYGLLDRTYFVNKPYNKIWRVLKAIGLILFNFHKNPKAILKSLNFFKYGKKALSLKLLYDSILFLDEDSYDIIHCHFGPNGNLGVLLRDFGLIKGKVVTTFHGYDMSAIVREQGEDVYNFLFENGDLFLPISEYWKEKLIKMGCNERSIIVYRMGIDTNKFQFSLRSKKHDIQLLTIGRFVEKKGIEYGIQAVAKIIKKHPSVEYKIAGKGPLISKLECLIEEHGVEKNVKLLGWQHQDEVIKLMKKADIFVAPSITSKEGDQEGIPLTIMEALATGLPVVATEHSGIPELVQDGRSGFLVPERDVEALAEKLEHLIEHPERWPKIGRAGRKFVEENYDINKLNDQLVEIYKNLIEK